MDHGIAIVHAVDHQSTTTADVVDALLRELLNSRRLHNDIESIRVIVLELLPLCFWVLPVKLDVLVASFNVLGDVHLDALVRGDDYARGAIQLEQLCENEAGGPCTEEEDLDTDGRGELVEPVDRACGGLEESRFLI